MIYTISITNTVTGFIAGLKTIKSINAIAETDNDKSDKQIAHSV
jgi:hypothetical protein